MLVSIVIPTYNNWGLTEDCLESIQDKTEVNYEIIVVDNNSTDKTVEKLRNYLGIKLISNDKNLGFAKASNQGAEIANGELILFLNNDTIVTKNWLRSMVKVLISKEEIGIVGNKLLFPETNLIQHAGVVLRGGQPGHIYYKKPSSLPEANRRRQYLAVTGACMLISKKLFLNLDGFDENFINGYEDVDLCLRAQTKGFKVIYCPDSVVYHYGSTTKDRHKYEKRNLNYFLNKWKSKL